MTETAYLVLVAAAIWFCYQTFDAARSFVDWWQSRRTYAPAAPRRHVPQVLAGAFPTTARLWLP